MCQVMRDESAYVPFSCCTAAANRRMRSCVWRWRRQLQATWQAEHACEYRKLRVPDLLPMAAITMITMPTYTGTIDLERVTATMIWPSAMIATP